MSEASPLSQSNHREKSRRKAKQKKKLANQQVVTNCLYFRCTVLHREAKGAFLDDVTSQSEFATIFLARVKNNGKNKIKMV